MFIDSHCHLDFPVFNDTLIDVLANANSVGVNDFLVPGTSIQSWKKIYKLSSLYSSIKTAYGMHPYFLATQNISDLEYLEEFAESHNAIAIGEIGLDYWPDQVERAIQLAFLTRQLSIAQNLQLPVILHARKSYDELFSILKKYHLNGGVIHAFTGSLVQAKRFIDLGFVLGVGGVVTYQRAKKTRQLFSTLQDSDFILETDSPDMPLFGYQGKINTPANIVKIAMVVAELRQQSIEDIARNNRFNILSVFSKWKLEDMTFAN